jgi:hypothetical protein
MTARRHRAIALLLGVALLVPASGCTLLAYDPTAGFEVAPFGDSYWVLGVICESAELVVQPLLFVVDTLSLSFLWDHRYYPFSGLVGMLLRLVAVVPGFSNWYAPIWDRWPAREPRPTVRRPAGSYPYGVVEVTWPEGVERRVIRPAGPECDPPDEQPAP